MAGDAYDTITNFWNVQDRGDYSALTELFADDAVVEDPVFGRFEGIEAIRGFFAKMNEVVPQAGCVFEAVEIQGGDTSAWCKWVAKYDDGRRVDGVGIYSVADGKLTYYRDYMDKG